MFQRIVVFLVLLWISGVQSRKLQCLDEGGRPVEWFYLYKLPRHVSGEGLDYIYLHPQSGGWKTSGKTIDNPQSIPGSLISQLTSDDLVIMYNDEPPEQKSDETNGHTKGVVAGNSEGGFWLVHSVPKYPPSDYSNYSYPPTGHLYGQSFLCISMNAGDLDSVGSLITYNEPHIYLGQVNPTLQTTYPNLHRLASEGKSWVTEPPFFNSKRVGNFTVFAKAHKFNKELYVDWVAPTLATNLMVESWLHGPGVIGSDCDKPFKVYNVENINLPSGSQFKTMEDHSKWAVGQTDNWICVGDINRAEHQERRGGGTVCQYSKFVASSYRSLVSSLYPCPKD